MCGRLPAAPPALKARARDPVPLRDWGVLVGAIVPDFPCLFGKPFVRASISLVCSFGSVKPGSPDSGTFS